LRAFRLRHDLTLDEVAELVGVSESELHRLERGERNPGPDLEARLASLRS
jgi:transcriptional regulator with XRE-family HTH domain